MKLGMELITARPAALRLGTFFETWLTTPGGTIRRSLGRDEFHLSLKVESGRRLAATGRTSICQLDLEAVELGENQVAPAVLVDAELIPGLPVIAGIRTNLFLDQQSLTEGLHGRLLFSAGEPVTFALNQEGIATTEVSPGRFLVDLTQLVSLRPGR